MNAHRVSGLDTRTFGIGVLSVTACILLVGLILVLAHGPQPAYAVGTSDRGGDYIMITQQISNSREAVAVIDAAAQRMILYAFDYNNKRLEIIQQVPLDQLPRPRMPEPDLRGGRRR